MGGYPMYSFWNYLDKPNKNLLYQYVNSLATNGYAQWREADNQEVNKNNAYYIIWFVYRYVLGCDTLEKALSQNHIEVLSQYKLGRSMFSEHSVLYIDVGDKSVKFWDIRDIYIVLEILYNRYNLIEQLQCFIRLSDGKRRSSCIKALEYLTKVQARNTK